MRPQPKIRVGFAALLCTALGVALASQAGSDRFVGLAWSFGELPLAPWIGVGAALLCFVLALRGVEIPTRARGSVSPRAWDLLAFVAGLALCVRFADLSRSGDFERVIYDLTHGVSLLKAEPLSPWMMLKLKGLAELLGFEPLPGLRFGLALWGGLGVVGCLHLARAIARDDPMDTGLAFVALLSAGSSALFFGHVETYTFAGVIMLFALARAARASRGEASGRGALALWTLACAFHMQMLCLGPAIAFALWEANESSQDRVRRTLVGLFLSAVSLAALQYLCGLYPPPYPQHFGGGDSEMLVPASNWFAQVHLVDVLNQVLLSAGPALLVALAMAWPHDDHDDESRMFLLAGTGWLAFVFLWNADLGAWRDWDLFSAMGWWVAAWAAHLCLRPGTGSAHRWLLLSVIAVQGARTLSFIAHNATPLGH